jgi:deoxyribonuclease-4
MQDDRFRGVPLCLETIDETIWAEEIQQLRQFAGEALRA